MILKVQPFRADVRSGGKNGQTTSFTALVNRRHQHHGCCEQTTARLDPTDIQHASDFSERNPPPFEAITKDQPPCGYRLQMHLPQKFSNVQINDLYTFAACSP